MRFHVRRLALLALGSTCVAVILLNTLRPHDVDPAALPVEIEQRQLRPLSLDERLARYSSSGNVTVSEQPLRPYVAEFAVKRRPPPLTSKQQEVKQEHPEDDVMSDRVPSSQNEHIRRQYVHLPEQSKNGIRTLWWSSSDDSPEDRIQVQMRHVPGNYRRDDQKLKTIYMPGGLGNEPEGQEKFIIEQCPVSACKLTSDRSVALIAEMRLLQGDATFYSARKPAGQIWTMFLLESPANTGAFSRAGDLINWTATYRWDSTLVTPYEKFVPYRNTSWLLERLAKRHRRTTAPETNVPQRNYAAGKTKMVAWFVSNCGPKNKRNEYANELAKYAFYLISPTWLFGPGRWVPKSHSSCSSSCCWYQFSRVQKSLRLS